MHQSNSCEAPLPLAVVIPARNAAHSLERCLGAVERSARGLADVIVVDDGSTDGTGDVARALGATVVRHEVSRGPAGARNAGARHAAPAIILFLDADIVLAEDAIPRVLGAFDADAGLMALFGSYDDARAERAFVSDYRNLLHHFVHQTSREGSESFWAGCGAIRKTAFFACGGFDERYRRPSIEDIELGGRLAQGGHRVRLEKGLQGTHLKHWSFGNVVLSDIRDRAYPWSRLILKAGRMPADLNLQYRDRVSGVLVWLAASASAGLLAADAWWAQPVFAAASPAALLAVAFLNRGFYRFLVKRRGALFAARVFPLHLLYYGYASGTFAWCWAEHVGGRLAGALRRSRQPELLSIITPLTERIPEP